jgi:hypothetical protein
MYSKLASSADQLTLKGSCPPLLTHPQQVISTVRKLLFLDGQQANKEAVNFRRSVGW